MVSDELALEKIRKKLEEPDILQEAGKAVAAGGPWANWTLDRQIWYLRVAAGMTQGELSRRSGISPARI